MIQLAKNAAIKGLEILNISVIFVSILGYSLDVF